MTRIIFAIAIILTGCTQPETAKRTLESSGLTNVQMEGYSLFGCDEKDQFHDKFSATDPKGRRVSGVVCGGFLKGATVRFD